MVGLPGVGMRSAGEEEQAAARVFYVAASRATQVLVIGVGGWIAGQTGILNYLDALNAMTHSLMQFARVWTMGRIGVRLQLIPINSN